MGWNRTALLLGLALFLWSGLDLRQAASIPLGELPGTVVRRLAGSHETGVVVGVVDGDTIDVAVNGKVERVRYVGVDTPETVDAGRPVECFGPEASARNGELVAGVTVRLERDVSNRDPYGRLLRHVYLPDGQLVGEVLVREGYARAVTYRPDVSLADRLAAAEREAKTAGRGLWGACPRP